VLDGSPIPFHDVVPVGVCNGAEGVDREQHWTDGRVIVAGSIPPVQALHHGRLVEVFQVDQIRSTAVPVQGADIVCRNNVLPIQVLCGKGQCRVVDAG